MSRRTHNELHSLKFKNFALATPHTCDIIGCITPHIPSIQALNQSLDQIIARLPSEPCQTCGICLHNDDFCTNRDITLMHVVQFP